MSPALFAVVDAVLSATLTRLGDVPLPHATFVRRWREAESMLGWWRSCWLV